MSEQDELLVERCISAHRDRALNGRIASEPAHYDLDDDGRMQAFEETLRQRALERALHPEGLSTTAQAVLRRIRRT